MTALTLEDINEASLAAAMCDDYSQYKKELAEVARMRRQYREENPQTEPKKPTPRTPAAVRRIPSNSIRCGSFEEAKQALNALCGV